MGAWRWPRLPSGLEAPAQESGGLCSKVCLCGRGGKETGLTFIERKLCIGHLPGADGGIILPFYS